MDNLSSQDIEDLVYQKLIQKDFSSVEAFLNLSFSANPAAQLLVVQSPSPHFLSVIANTLSIEESDFCKYSVKELSPSVFSLALTATEFLNSQDVAVASMLMSTVEEVTERYFDVLLTPAPQLAQWGNNLISLEKSLNELGFEDRQTRLACSGAQWEEIGLLLLKSVPSSSPAAFAVSSFKMH